MTGIHCSLDRNKAGVLQRVYIPLYRAPVSAKPRCNAGDRRGLSPDSLKQVD
jgi:hypothetical protein